MKKTFTGLILMSLSLFLVTGTAFASGTIEVVQKGEVQKIETQTANTGAAIQLLDSKDVAMTGGIGGSALAGIGTSVLAAAERNGGAPVFATADRDAEAMPKYFPVAVGTTAETKEIRILTARTANVCTGGTAFAAENKGGAPLRV